MVKSGSGLPLSEARRGVCAEIPGEAQVHHDVGVARLDGGLRIAAAVLRIGKQADLSFANLEMKPALAVGGHVAIRLVFAVKLHVARRRPACRLLSTPVRR